MFFARSAGIPAPTTVADAAAAAILAASHFGLGLGSAIVFCVPVPADVALPDQLARAAVDQAIAEADAAVIRGPALTPWLLARIAAITSGASVRANTSLIVNDARFAGELASQLSGSLAAAGTLGGSDDRR